jgi:hypothetical protein
MSAGQWFYVDGRLTEMRGTHDEIIEQQRELRADGHTVKQARKPRPISPRSIAIASSHRRG